MWEGKRTEAEDADSGEEGSKVRHGRGHAITRFEKSLVSRLILGKTSSF
jgi:hypothetical protein